jgi:hypothetical protein
MALVPEDSEMEQKAAKSPSLDSLVVEFKILGESSLQAGVLLTPTMTGSGGC